MRGSTRRTESLFAIRVQSRPSKLYYCSYHAVPGEKGLDRGHHRGPRRNANSEMDFILDLGTVE